jgi:hypothetical protein
MRIAFTGNPNSGKTTMYNALTGRNEKVGNWAGVTVDRKEAPIKKAYAGGKELVAVDLPGAYSMSPFTAEESITSAYVKQENPDVIVNIVDATNLSRSLFLPPSCWSWASLCAAGFSQHVQPGLGLYRQGRYHHFAVQHRCAADADLRLESPAGR